MNHPVKLALFALAGLCLAFAPMAMAAPASDGAPGARAGALAGKNSPDDPAYPLTRPNPEAEIGKLDNGLRYGVMSRGGTRQVSIILYIGAGSGDETDAERGTAHFLEHMAFNGSRNFPPGTVMKRFADIGATIGRDQNAETGFDSTMFSLDISEITPERLGMSFNWLRDVADGLTISQSEVDRERGVILSEYASSRSAMTDIALQSESFLAPDLLGPKRAPIGTRESIMAASAQSIGGFYHRWYRPETSIVVAVGDLPRDQLKAMIVAAFGSWTNPTPPAAPVDLGRIDPHRATQALTLTDAHDPAGLQVCRMQAKDPPLQEGVQSRLRDFEQAVWQGVLDRRLSERASAARPPFLSAEVERVDVYNAASLGCVTAMLRDSDWRPAVGAVSAETRRMALYGITEEEYKTSVQALNASVEAEVGEAPTMTGAELAKSIVSNLTQNGTFSTAEEDQRIGRLALARLTRAQVDAEFARVWTRASPPVVVAILPQALDRAAVTQAWRVAQATPAPSPPAQHPGHPWAYASFGPPGTVVSRQPIPDAGAMHIAYANGLRLNFKTSQNAQDHVEIRIRFGAGQQEVAAKDLPVARLATSMLRLGGLGKNDFEDTSRFCEGHECGFELDMLRDAFVIGGETRPEDLDVELQLITAYLSDPGFRPEVDARIPTTVRSLYQAARSEPSLAAVMARDKALPEPRVKLFPDDHDLDNARSADFARLLGPALKNDALEVTIIGDIDQATVEDAVAKTLGALPPRPRADDAKPDAPKVHFASSAPPVIRVTHDGSAEKATVLATWPLFVWTPDRVREQRTLDLLGQIMEMQAIQEIRQKLGKAYSPQVQVQLGRGGDQGSLLVSIDTSPPAADAVVTSLRKIARDLAAGDITDEMLERARRPVLDNGATREISNPWWIEMLDGSWAHPDQLLASKTWLSDYSTISLAEVKAEAAKWLAPDPLLVIATPAGASQADAATPHAAEGGGAGLRERVGG
ncbi:MAG: M16 family metallopeptidase [Caulobacterales bacterium]